MSKSQSFKSQHPFGQRDSRGGLGQLAEGASPLSVGVVAGADVASLAPLHLFARSEKRKAEADRIRLKASRTRQGGAISSPAPLEFSSLTRVVRALARS